MLTENTALMLIDVQQGFDDPVWGPRNNLDAETHIAELLAAWRATGRPVIHVQHMSTEPTSPLRPGQRGNDLRTETGPINAEPVFQKTVNSAFIGTNLADYLHDHNIETMVLVGLTTNHCVSTTARMAGNLGFTTYIVEDATATFARTDHHGRTYTAEEVHALALASLHEEFATILDTKTVLARLETLHPVR